jgi:hypothetical protein
VPRAGPPSAAAPRRRSRRRRSRGGHPALRLSPVPPRKWPTNVETGGQTTSTDRARNATGQVAGAATEKPGSKPIVHAGLPSVRSPKGAPRPGRPNLGPTAGRQRRLRRAVSCPEEEQSPPTTPSAKAAVMVRLLAGPGGKGSPCDKRREGGRFANLSRSLIPRGSYCRRCETPERLYEGMAQRQSPRSLPRPVDLPAVRRPSGPGRPHHARPVRRHRRQRNLQALCAACNLSKGAAE